MGIVSEFFLFRTFLEGVNCEQRSGAVFRVGGVVDQVDVGELFKEDGGGGHVLHAVGEEGVDVATLGGVEGVG